MPKIRFPPPQFENKQKQKSPMLNSSHLGIHVKPEAKKPCMSIAALTRRQRFVVNKLQSEAMTIFQMAKSCLSTHRQRLLQTKRDTHDKDQLPMAVRRMLVNVRETGREAVVQFVQMVHMHMPCLKDLVHMWCYAHVKVLGIEDIMTVRVQPDPIRHLFFHILKLMCERPRLLLQACDDVDGQLVGFVKENMEQYLVSCIDVCDICWPEEEEEDQGDTDSEFTQSSNV